MNFFSSQQPQTRPTLDNIYDNLTTTEKLINDKIITEYPEMYAEITRLNDQDNKTRRTIQKEIDIYVSRYIKTIPKEKLSTTQTYYKIAKSNFELACNDISIGLKWKETDVNGVVRTINIFENVNNVQGPRNAQNQPVFATLPEVLTLYNRIKNLNIEMFNPEISSKNTFLTFVKEKQKIEQAQNILTAFNILQEKTNNSNVKNLINQYQKITTIVSDVNNNLDYKQSFFDKLYKLATFDFIINQDKIYKEKNVNKSAVITDILQTIATATGRNLENTRNKIHNIFTKMYFAKSLNLLHFCVAKTFLLITTLRNRLAPPLTDNETNILNKCIIVHDNLTFQTNNRIRASVRDLFTWVQQLDTWGYYNMVPRPPTAFIGRRNYDAGPNDPQMIYTLEPATLMIEFNQKWSYTKTEFMGRFATDGYMDVKNSFGVQENLNVPIEDNMEIAKQLDKKYLSKANADRISQINKEAFENKIEANESTLKNILNPLKVEAANLAQDYIRDNAKQMITYSFDLLRSSASSLFAYYIKSS